MSNHNKVTEKNKYTATATNKAIPAKNWLFTDYNIHVEKNWEQEGGERL